MNAVDRSNLEAVATKVELADDCWKCRAITARSAWRSSAKGEAGNPCQQPSRAARDQGIKSSYGQSATGSSSAKNDRHAWLRFPGSNYDDDFIQESEDFEDEDNDDE
jgi:hypothetical protein